MKLTTLIALFVALCVVGWFFVSWLLMLFIGITHRDWWPAVPLLGWHAALPLGFILTLLLGSAAGGSRGR